MVVSPEVGAFCAHGMIEIQSRHDGPLAGLTFGVKDLFDVAGVPTGAGSPDWLATHPVPQASARAVLCLLDAGARMVGKTQTDELAWSLNGQNHHYGTPINPAAPGRIPGGSSSGSAAATAAGLVDFALGSDTGGSVRLPASYCGLYGMRSSHGRISITGAVPLAPSYDSVGWFTRDAELFSRVGRALLPDAGQAVPVSRVLVADDLFGLAGDAVSTALAPALAQVGDLIGWAGHVDLADGRLMEWRDAFRLIQSSEAWETHGDWVTRVGPAFGPGIGDRFAAAARLDPGQIEVARRVREAVRARLADIVPPGTLLVIPTAPGIAPLLSSTEVELETFRARALALLCAAGHAGMPQISLPMATLEGCPLGLSVIAAHGQDEALLDLAVRLAAPEADDGRA